MENVFSRTARYYDKIYAGKDYSGEAQRLIAFLGIDHEPKKTTLLDVACGTGLHVSHLVERFQVEGLDVCPELLRIAKERVPDVIFHLGDMTNFTLSKQFDVVTCLGGAIGSVKTLDRLKDAVSCMATHLMPKGVLVIEPWFTPENWHPNTVHGVYIDEPELKIARINTSFVRDRVSVLDLHHLIGTPKGTEHIVEHHELGLFEVEEMIIVMEEAGMKVNYDADGITGRGLYIGRKNG